MKRCYLCGSKLTADGECERCMSFSKRELYEQLLERARDCRKLHQLATSLYAETPQAGGYDFICATVSTRLKTWRYVNGAEHEPTKIKFPVPRGWYGIVWGILYQIAEDEGLSYPFERRGARLVIRKKYEYMDVTLTEGGKAMVAPLRLALIIDAAEAESAHTCVDCGRQSGAGDHEVQVVGQVVGMNPMCGFCRKKIER